VFKLGGFEFEQVLMFGKEGYCYIYMSISVLMCNQQDRDKWNALVKAGSVSAGRFSSDYTIVGLSSSAQFHRVC
jgi:hypothetical protein